MLKRELKVNLKSFIIWTSVLMGLFLMVFLMYPSIITSDSMKAMDDLLKVFPADVLKAFNMDISSIDSAFGWLKTEGFVFALLIVGCYSGLLGSNIILKEESDKTIEYLNSLPVKRNTIIMNKVLVGLIYITSMVILLGIFNFIGLYLSGDFDKLQFILLSFTPLLPAYVLFFLCMFISMFTHKTKKMLGASLGIVLVSYVLQTFSTLSETVEFLKYISVFTLADIRNVITNTSINWIMILISSFLSILFLILTIIFYNKKELV